jgi:chemotaxis protein MotB
MKHEQNVIRIVKKKGGHAAHHGGAWKVAYADFVTAMMAFFLVMWIISMDQPVKEDIQNYFNNPFSASQSKAGISQLAAGGESPIAYGMVGAMNAKNWRDLALEAQKDQFKKAESNIEHELSDQPELTTFKEHVEISINNNGLLIELVEAENSLFFKTGSAEIPQATRTLLGLIGRELGHLSNPISIEGHTDTMPYPAEAEYTNWELSADRANAARRILERTGLKRHQVVEVRGYADSRLRNPSNPTHYSNRRVSIMVNYQGISQAALDNQTKSVGKPDGSQMNLDLRPLSAPATPVPGRNRNIE